jgi:pyruvate kinase
MIYEKFKRTKIVATIGPASNKPEVFDRLIDAGVDTVRLNFSHGKHEEHAAVLKMTREMAVKYERPLAVIADLQGPKIRAGNLPAEGLTLVTGSEVKFVYGDDYEPGGPIPVQHDIPKHVKVGERMFLRDGLMEVDVKEVTGGVIIGDVKSGGVLLTHQGINLPDTDMAGQILTTKDQDDLNFIITLDVDYVALSFVQTATDVANLKQWLADHGSDAKVIAKIETAAAVKCLADIAKVADGLMVARGDLAVETSPQRVPVIQRRMIEFARAARIPVIVATQMLESMITAPRPTRAEVSDIATAVMEGADAVMLSGETAMGAFPVEVVTLMSDVIRVVERDEMARHEYGLPTVEGIEANPIASAAKDLAERLGAKAIIAETATGQTARNISSLRPEQLIVMVTHLPRTHNQLALVWGAWNYLQPDPSLAAETSLKFLKEQDVAVAGDKVVVVSGNQPGIPGGTDSLKVEAVV